MLLASSARAQCLEGAVGCDEQELDWSYRRALFDGIDYDTGWVPGGSPVQMRVVVTLAGETNIDLGADPATYWPDPLTLSVPGRPGSGHLRVGYGFEFRVYFRFDVTVAGIRYNVERELDIPSVPMDLLLAAEGDFDPFLFPPSAPFMLTDSTEPVPLYDADLGRLISLPIGVSGGFRLDIAAALMAAYHTERVQAEDTILTEVGATAPLLALAPEGFGAFRETEIHPEGVLRFITSLALSPIAYIEVAGRRFDLPIGALSFDIADTERDVIFDDVTLHVPLPDVALGSESIAFAPVELGDEALELLRIDNDGEAPLEVALVAPAGVVLSSAMLVIPPASRVHVEVRHVPMTSAPLAGALELTTNDPDTPRLSVALSGLVTMADAGPADTGAAGMDAGADTGMMPDVGSSDAGMPDGDFPDALDLGGVSGGACGCRTAGGGPGAPWGLAAMAMLVAWRRRRRAF